MRQPAPQPGPLPLRVESVRFLGEQDGAPERELKLKLVRRFGILPAVARAYLAVVAYSDLGNALTIALCVRLNDQSEIARRSILAVVATDFASLFGGSQHLDVIFISAAQEVALARVCKPFYSAPRTGPVAPPV